MVRSRVASLVSKTTSTLLADTLSPPSTGGASRVPRLYPRLEILDLRDNETFCVSNHFTRSRGGSRVVSSQSNSSTSYCSFLYVILSWSVVSESLYLDDHMVKQLKIRTDRLRLLTIFACSYQGAVVVIMR
ncbi:MAG: hypothetical protein J07HQX50_01528 [Haloquadratum sp. J07HQX50]|nr:MAG: hypothetical protein J07HQX50_01528 [Haloquadratum sp. J07HQX50]